MIYIDANEQLTTWRHVAEAGGYTLYQGQANAGDVVIRFGANHGRYQNRYPAGVRVLNPRLMLSKSQQYRALTNAGVRVPRIFANREEWEGAGRPQLIAKPDIGQMGTGVGFIDAPRWGGNRPLYQEYINKEREFRAMMVGNLLAFFMEKHRPANGDVRWNEHQGSRWTAVQEDRNLRNRVKELAEAACQALGYDFGAVDLILRGNDMYVLEVNSRPEFGPANARRFANAVNQYIDAGQRAVEPRRRNQEARPQQRDQEGRGGNAEAGRRAQPEPAARVVQRRFCHQCGAPVGEAFRFCEGCGRQL